MLKVFSFKDSDGSHLDKNLRGLIDRRKRVLGPAYQLFYSSPLHLVKGAGAVVWDAEGRSYLDLYNNVPSVGHCHPRVLAAMQEQASAINTHTRYLHEKVVNYAERLLATMPAVLSNAMFTCTASEANDLALRIARDYTGGTGVIVTSYAYHGITSAVAEVSPSMGDYVPIGRDVRVVPAPRQNTGSSEQVGKIFAEEVKAAIKEMRRYGVKPAALLLDTIFHSDGILTDPPGFLAEAVRVFRQEGGLFIADEVQPGFGRTGKTMWGFERHDVIPDIVTMGKPMGNGHPMGGLAIKANVLDKFAHNAAYFNTFGGNPVSAAVGLAVLDVIRDEGLMANAELVGEYLKVGLQSYATECSHLGEIRGSGLFIGVDIVNNNGEDDPEAAKRLVEDLRENGALIGVTGPSASVLKIRPPLCLSKEQATSFLSIFDGSLKRCFAEG
ncbi:MAG: aspartate aminotransferase family protein [Burkholderiaceae bacterium]|nr:MAG: aspartate aminotransferase family protein [Burkholderiaceae bacterium]